MNRPKIIQMPLRAPSARRTKAVAQKLFAVTEIVENILARLPT